MCKRFSSRFLIGFSSDFSTKSNPLNFTPTIFSLDFHPDFQQGFFLEILFGRNLG